jgi:hypothetical protein
MRLPNDRFSKLCLLHYSSTCFSHSNSALYMLANFAQLSQLFSRMIRALLSLIITSLQFNMMMPDIAQI